MTRKVRIGLRIAVALFVTLVFVAVIALVTLRSPWFHEKVMETIVTELERVTDGKASLGEWAFNWRLLTVEFSDLTLHGTEPANVPPLLRARSVKVGLKIIS